jgi:hypothetical protein
MSNPSASEEPLALRLSDTQLDEIMRLAQPLALHCRDALLRILAYELRGDVGDGELHRLARTIIRDNHLFDPPLVTSPSHRQKRRPVKDWPVCISNCVDCGVGTMATREVYMVRDDVWEQAWDGRRKSWHGKGARSGNSLHRLPRIVSKARIGALASIFRCYRIIRNPIAISTKAKVHIAK